MAQWRNAEKPAKFPSLETKLRIDPCAFGELGMCSEDRQINMVWNLNLEFLNGHQVPMFCG